MHRDAILTDKEAAAIPVPEKGEIWVRVVSPLDHKGLYVRVTRSGGRSWYYRYTMDGKQRKVFIAPVQSMKLSEVLQEHAVLARTVKGKGVDIVATRKLEKQAVEAKIKALTLKQLVDLWIEQYLEPNVGDHSYRNQVSRLNKHVLPRLGTLIADEIKPRHVIEMRDAIFQQGKGSTSNSVLRLLRQIYQWGNEELLVSTNPARDIKGRHKDRKREIVWTDEQLKDIWNGLEFGCGVGPQGRLALKLLMLTGCRRAEIVELRHSEIMFDDVNGAAVITLPKERVKTRVEFHIYLPPFAAGLLKQAVELSTSKEFVFNSRSPYRPMSANQIGSGFKSMLNKLGLPGCVHVMRHTFVTSCVRLGCDPVIADSCLNHNMPGTAAVYLKAHSFPRQKQVWEIWNQHVEQVVTGKSVLSDGRKVLNLFNGQ